MARSRTTWVVLSLVLAAGTMATAQAQTAHGRGGNAAADREERRALRGLRQVNRRLARTDARLERVLGYIGPPEQPVATVIRAELQNVRTGAQKIADRVSPYLATPGGTGPSAPPAAGPGTAAPPGDTAAPASSETALSQRQVRRAVRVLRRIVRRLGETDARLARVLGYIGPPEQPVSARIRTQLEAVKAAAEGIVGRVSPYLGTIPPPPPDDGNGGTVPPPPSDG